MMLGLSLTEEEKTTLILDLVISQQAMIKGLLFHLTSLMAEIDRIREWQLADIGRPNTDEVTKIYDDIKNSYHDTVNRDLKGERESIEINLKEVMENLRIPTVRQNIQKM